MKKDKNIYKDYIIVDIINHIIDDLETSSDDSGDSNNSYEE